MQDVTDTLYTLNPQVGVALTGNIPDHHMQERFQVN